MQRMCITNTFLNNAFDETKKTPVAKRSRFFPRNWKNSVRESTQYDQKRKTALIHWAYTYHQREKTVLWNNNLLSFCTCKCKFLPDCSDFVPLSIINAFPRQDFCLPAAQLVTTGQRFEGKVFCLLFHTTGTNQPLQSNPLTNQNKDYINPRARLCDIL